MKYLEEHPITREGIDWFACVVWGLILGALLLASVWGHSVVSAQVLGEGPVVAPTPPYIVIDGDPMPRIYLDYYMPWVGK